MCYGDIAHGHDGYYEEWARSTDGEQLSDDILETDYDGDCF